MERFWSQHGGIANGKSNASEEVGLESQCYTAAHGWCQPIYCEGSQPWITPIVPSQISTYNQSLSSNSICGETILRPTPSTVEWPLTLDVIEEIYDFYVPKGVNGAKEDKEPYFWLPIEATIVFPSIVYLDRQESSQKDGYPCMYPQCPKKSPLTRFSDLQRHYRTVHATISKELFKCDYKKCQYGCNRNDGLRDHLRDYHREYLIVNRRANEAVASSTDIEKLQDWAAHRQRHPEPEWWRCPKCLGRVRIIQSGYRCADCEIYCDAGCIRHLEKERASQGLPLFSECASYGPQMANRHGVEPHDSSLESYAIYSHRNRL